MARRSGTRLAGWLLAAAVLVVVAGWLMLRPSAPDAAAPPPPVAAAPPPMLRTAIATKSRLSATAVGLPPAPPLPPPRPDSGAFGPFSLLNPAATVSTQVRLLEEGNDEAFRETFVPSLRDQVTPEAIERCRKRLAQVRVQPDWEMAEDTTVDGERVERVSMWGKSTTGFHDEKGRWLADALWCVPTGLP